jgi:hypothetical protein
LEYNGPVIANVGAQ